MEYLEITFQAMLVIEHLEGLISVGAGCYDCFSAGRFDHRHVFLGLIEKILPVPHLIGSSAAARFSIAGDAEIHARLLEYFHRGLGQLLQTLIVARQTADVIEHIHFLFCSILQLQTRSPVAPPAGCGYHGSLLPQVRDCLDPAQGWFCRPQRT